MSLSVFNSLSLDALKTTGVEIELTNRNTIHPIRLIENVLVQVDDPLFPVNFYILDMKKGYLHNGVTTIILSKHFMKTVETNINIMLTD